MAIKNKNNRIVILFVLLVAIVGVMLFQQAHFGTVSAEAKKSNTATEKVFVGGMPVGIILQSHGVLVIGKLDIITSDGVKNPAEKAGITIGDVITKVNDTDLNGTEELAKILKSFSGDTPLKLTVKRNGKETEKQLLPVKDVASKEYKLGLWVRDTAAGVGTVTYVKPNGDFAALGHPICDPESGEVIPVSSGKVFNSLIMGINKGTSGRAGELKGLFSRDTAIGTVRQNCRYGVYGKLYEVPKNPLYPEPIPVANRSEIKQGKAKIVTTIKGSEPKEYSIEIVKKNNQKSIADRSLVLKVTDKELLNATGGIVQGMSGSPIIQNGKLIGAVTHVFINNPTQGYGLYLDWMLVQ